jgi:hypothetical protein
MKYTVYWTADAEDALAEIWLSSSFSPAVTAAQALMDVRLSASPHGAGHHLSEGLYRIDAYPLSATFTIDDANRSVEVSWVWYQI